MSNPFEKYFQATERQQSKLDKVLSTPSASLFQGYEPPNYSTPPEKSAGNILNDAAIATAKTFVGVPQALVGLADIAAYGIDSAISDTPVENTGYIGKAFENAGFRFKDAQDIISTGYSDAYKSQQTGLQKEGEFNLADGLFSQNNADVLAAKAAYVADNPALAVNTTLESLGYMLAGGALGTAAKAGAATLAARAAAMRVGALEGAAAGSTAGTAGAIGGRVAGGLAGAVRTPTTAGLVAAEASVMNSVGQRVALGALGEGGVSAGILQENIRNQTEGGLTSPEQTNLAAVGGAGVGLLGYGFGRLANRAGAADIDTALIRSTVPTSVAGYLKSNPITRVGKGALFEGTEEIPQENLENFVENLATDKGQGNILYGAADSTVLGFGAGALMGGAVNLPSGIIDAGKDISTGLGKAKEVIGGATQLKSFDTLSNPEHKNYNPAQAFNSQVKNLESNDETLRTQAQASVDKIHADLQTTMDKTNEQLSNIDTALKAMPPVAQMTDAQKLEVDALAKARTQLTAKSDQLVEHFTTLVDAQVSAQEHRDAKQGTQFTEEQAKADIAALTQPKPSQTVADIAGTQYPVEVTGEPVTHEDGTQYSPVRYTDPTTNQVSDTFVPHDSIARIEDPTTPEQSTVQQEALNRVTKHFSKYSNDDLDLLATSSVLSEEQRNSLRLLSKSKRELAAIQDPSQVFDNILNGYKGKTIQESHRGLNQYTDMVNTAVATNNEQLASLALDGLGAFTDDHTAKKDTINEAFGLVQNGTYKEIQVVRTQDGTWGMVPFTAQEVRAGKNTDGVVFLEGKALKDAMNKVGGFNVHINSDKKGAITQINNETQLIQDRFDALSGVAESFVGVTPKPIDTSTAPTVDTPSVTEPSDTTAPVDSPAPEASVQSDDAVPPTVEEPVVVEEVPPVNVWAGSNENAGLSNLATRLFTFGSKKYQSVEHAYQSLKSGSFDQQTYDKYAGTENKKIAGNRGTHTTNNSNIRLMEKLMSASFEQNKDAMALLQKTGDAVITHTQDKSIWGKEFPRILMEIRESNKATPSVEATKAQTTPAPSQDTPAVTEYAKQVPVETEAEPKAKTTDVTAPVSKAAETIYNKLGDKTSVPKIVDGAPNPKGNNVIIEKVYQLAGVAYAKSIGAIFSLRVDKDSKGNKTDKHFGNPFSSVASEIAKGLVATESTKESVLRYLEWVLSETTTIKPQQHAWIREQLKLGNLKDKQIVYYKELNQPSHANALDYLINEYDWGTVEVPVSDEQTSTESQVNSVATEDVKITVLQGVTDEIAAEERKKPFNLRNILKGYFTQSITKEDATGANPLVTVKDFLSNFDVRTQVSKWLNDRRKPTEEQLEQVEHFKKFHTEFAKALNHVFNTQVAGGLIIDGKESSVNNKSNLVGYMDVAKKGRKLEENVVTALALSAYSYLIKQGNKVMNTTEELETLFRLKKGVRAPLEIEQMFRFAGQEMPIVVKALGTDAAKALGLKVREDQDPTLQDRLNTSLGILAMEAMAKAGFVVIDTLEGKPLTDFLTAIKAVRESKAHTIEDEYDFETDIDAETQITKFTMVRPNALMEGESKTVFDGNRPVLTEGLPTLNSPLVNELIEANKDTKGFMSYLFGVDVGLTTPLKEMPKKFFQKLINGTDASVPSSQVALLTEAQKHSFTMRTNTVVVFSAMQKLGENSQFLKEVLGIWIDDHVLSRTHVTERDSLQAKAQNDWTAVLNGLEWADATLDENGQYTQFYDTQFVAQNQRQHLNSNMFSAQASQIHRAMAALTGFSTTIDLSQDEQGVIKDEALLNLFYQAVGEGLEGLDDYLKADILSKAEAGLHQFFTVDKVYGDYYVPALKAFLQTTESKAAVEAMKALIETGTIDTTQQKAIAAFVDKGKMGAQSLQSLIALAELDIAQASGTTFTTTIGFGSDGVNHGISAANVLTGVISKDMRQQTGIFPIAEKGQVQISNMQEVYRRKITDYYVDFGKVMSGKLRDLVNSFAGGQANPFVQGMTALFPKFEVLGDTGELRNLLDMRKIAKIWAIPFNYSAGKAALQRALARGFLAGIYGNMNKLANEALDTIDAKNEKGVTAEQLKALDLKLETVKLKTNTLQDNLNKALRKYGMSVTLPAPELLNEEDKGKLSNAIENTLMQAAIDLHGEAAWQATEEFAKEYLQVRNVYTEAEKASFTLFDLVRNQLIEEKRASRKYSNVATKYKTAEELNANEAEYFDLTTVEMAEVDAVLAAMQPMFNTALSIGSESTNDADSVTNPSGVSVRKHKMQREPASGLRAVNTLYGKELDANNVLKGTPRNIGLTKVVEENAGVASSANAVQSIDAYVAAKVQGFMDALNVHDAAIFGLKDFLKGTKKQNEEHLKALTNYQLGLEHAKMLVKVYQGYKAFMATQELALKSEDVKVKENAQKLITKAKKQMEVLLWGEQMFKGDTALKINGETVYKGGLIPKLQAANVNIEDGAKIEEAIGAFINYALKQDLQKLEVLLDTYSIHQFAGEGGMHQLTDENRASIDEQKDLVNKAKADLQAELKDKTVEQVAEVKTPETTKQVSPKVTTAEKVKPKEMPVKPMTPLVKLLRESKSGTLSIVKLIEHLKYANDTVDANVRAAQLAVLSAITPLIDNSIEVYYSSGIDNDYEGYGFFDKETNTIHINSDKEAEGAVKASLVIHELLHAALANRIETLRAAIKSGSTENSQAIAALKNLDALRESLLLKITDPVLRDMLKDTDEFISYGLTDSRLQKVLLNTTVSPNGRGFGDNWRKFIAVVGRILNFGTKDISALAAFAHDTAALLDTIGTVAPIGSPTQTRLFSTQSAEDLVNGQSSLDIMQALPHSNTGAFNQQLDRLITDEIGQLYNQDDAAKARIDEIQTLTASDALNAGFNLSRKEQYVQQALQYAVAAYMKIHAGGANVGQLNRVYHAAKVKIDPTGKDFHEGDWATATQQEQDAAKAKYDFLFDSTKEGYMDRFVSMALASESVNSLLDIALPLTKPNTQDKTWFEKVNDWVSYVMAWLTNKYVRLNPVAGASNQLSQLMDNLVKLDIRNRQEGVALHQKAWNAIGIVTTPLNNALKGTQGFLANSDALRNSRFLPIRALGAMAVLRSEEAAKAIPKLIIDMRNNQLPNTKMGELANILLEASGVGTLRNAFDSLIRQTNLNAKNRQDIVDNVKKAVNSWFKTPLTKLRNKAVTVGLLHTDAQALLENYSVEDIVDMALHEGKLNAEIAKLKKEIAKNPNGNGMLNVADKLGYYMVTRIGGKGLVKSALGIAIGLGMQYQISVEQADSKLVHQLDMLVSLLAMTHVPNSDKAILAELYKTDAEGIHATIQLHSGLVNDSMKDFQENPLNMVKGWMPEITNPFIEIKAANSMVERQQMESEGWVLIDELKRDKHDKGSPKYLMKHNDFGYQRLVSGAVDLQRTARSGTEAIDRTNPKYLGITQARYQDAARLAAIPNSSFDPSKEERGLITAYDTDGVALAYNYEMDNETRDAHLDRKHNVGELLGTMGGLNYYKPAKKKQSNKVAEVLFDDYKENYSQNPNAYLKLSHKSSDPKVVEMWRMLPQDFRDKATELYGKGNPIIIRNEAFNMAFGFKKFSVVANAFDTKAADRNKFQSGFVGFTTMLRGNTAQADFAKAEHVTQEIVKAIKDFIVIRSGTTMMWNIFANVLMLMANGINPFTIIKDWVFAVTNVRAYQKLNSQLIQAQADLVAGKDPTALKQKIGALKAELKANPLSEYINAGLLSSIVEDVNIQSGDYTYVSAFKQSVDEKTQWIPKPVKTAAKVLTIAPSTKLYQFLATTTQLSDFVAKYSMSQHLQSKGMIQSESIVEASQTFINYDVPTSQGLQYANDMGLFMFTKFFLRIQAVLFKLLGKRAGSVIAQHLLVENLTGAEGILSPMMIGHIDNIGIESSVFGLPSAFFSIGTVDAVTDFGTPF